MIPGQLIHANSSKVWVKTKVIKDNGDNLAPVLNELKTAYILFENGTFREQQLIHLGSKNGVVGSYGVSISETNDTSLVFFYPGNEEEQFQLEYIDSKQMKLSNQNETWFFETLKAPKL